MEKLDLFGLIDELQEEIEMSPVKGLAKHRMVDGKIVLEIIEDIRKAAHDEFDFSKKVLDDKEQIVASAEAQAEEIVRQAKLRADEMIKKDNVTQAAYDRATKMLESSKSKAGEIRKSANTYAEEVFDELEDFYRESIALIKENKARLKAKPAEKQPKTEEKYSG